MIKNPYLRNDPIYSTWPAEQRKWMAMGWDNGHNAGLNNAASAIQESAPPLNAELSMQGGAGPFEDAGMAAYVEGFHDAWASVNALLVVAPEPGYVAIRHADGTSKTNDEIRAEAAALSQDVGTE